MDAGVPMDDIARKSVIVQYIAHCDETGVALSVGHKGVASGGTEWSRYHRRDGLHAISGTVRSWG